MSMPEVADSFHALCKTGLAMAHVYSSRIAACPSGND